MWRLRVFQGGKVGPRFELPPETLPEEGLAFLTASAAHEDAQESDELRSSFFTHAFVSGLLGAADRDGNGEVAIDEAYRYAYEGTIRATSRTFHGTQHPAFRYDFRGQGSVVLTRPEAYVQARATLRFAEGFDFLLMRDAADGPVVAELGASAVQRALSMRPGRYFVRARGPDVMYEGSLSAGAGAVRRVELSELTRIEYARLVRKGHAAVAHSHAIELGGQLRTALPNAETPCAGAVAAYGIDFASFGARARFGACHSGFDNAAVDAAINAYDPDLRISHSWDAAALAVELGVGAGLTLFSQTFEARGRAPDRLTLAPFLSIAAAAVLDLGWHGAYLRLDLGGDAFHASARERVEPSRARRPLRATPHARCGSALLNRWLGLPAPRRATACYTPGMTQASDPPSLDASPPLEGALEAVDQAFHELYGDARAEIKHETPVLVLLTEELVLYRGGTRSAFPTAPKLFHVLKAVAHIPVAMFTVLCPNDPHVSTATQRSQLERLHALTVSSRAQLEALREPLGLHGAALSDAELSVQTSLELLNDAVRGDVPAARIEGFAQRLGPVLLRLTHVATRMQLETLHASVERALGLLSDAERGALQVVVTGDHQARNLSLGMQYFRARMREPEGTEERLAYAEGVSDEQAALQLVGTRRLDHSIAQAFFGDRKRLQRDVLGDSAAALLRDASFEPI